VFFFFFSLILSLHPISSLFPYTTLFRSLLLILIGWRGRFIIAFTIIGFIVIGFAVGFYFLLAVMAPLAIRLGTIFLHIRLWFGRSEEHTSELQSRGHLVCRLLLEKKNKI